MAPSKSTAPLPKKNKSVFEESILPQGQSRLGWFGTGFIMECVALAIVIVIPMLMPQKFEAVTHYWVMPVEAPHIEAWKPQPVKPAPVVKIKREVVKEVPKVVVPEVVAPKPKIYTPVFSAPVVRTAVRKADAAPVVVKALPEPTPALALGSSAIPTLRKPKEAVQTGGFGDPNSIPDNGKTNRNPNMVQQGGYDMPTGPGTGNGTGGANGAKGVVASAGFGNGIAAGSPGSANRTVQQSGFGDEHAATEGPRVKQTAAVSNTTPVEILFKPKPIYTDEARAKKIEGDVLLQVVFSASGEVKVERVVQGLGYGLEDSAESAARQIRFRPAKQAGQPVDSTAIVHITFELAY